MKGDLQSKGMIVRARLVMIFLLLCLLIRLAEQAMPFQWGSPVFYGLGLEIPFRLYWFFHLQDILIYSKLGSLLFTILLFGSAVFSIIYPGKTIGFICFSILYYFYFLTFSSITILHSHPMAASLWIGVPFVVRSDESRKYLWEGLRYYACFVYFVAFILKLMFGSFLAPQNGVHSVMINLAGYLYYFPDTSFSKIIAFTISNPLIPDIGFIITVILQGSMVIGFFTKKYDFFLLLFIIFFHTTTYFFSDVFFIEMIVLVFLFLSEKQIFWIRKKIPVLAGR